MSHISGSSSGDYPSGDEVVLEDKNGDAEIRELEKSETCDDSWKIHSWCLLFTMWLQGLENCSLTAARRFMQCA